MLCIALKSPTRYAEIPASQRRERCYLNDDFCTIDDKEFFVYGSLELPVYDNSESFIWGVWTQISEQDYIKTDDLIGVVGREAEPPYEGRLASDIPLYPPMLDLQVRLITQPAGLRPLVYLEPAPHPLVREQQEGISTARVQEIIAWNKQMGH